MGTTSVGCEFLYPISRLFPFDEVCEQIVRALEARDWDVPGISVEFSDYGSGEQKFRFVNYIRSKDFKLWFCRKQRTMPGGQWNDIAAVTQIIIPKKELHVYEDESGPTLYLYVGNDYEKDREQFMNGSKVNSKLNKKPRTYLMYRGQCFCEGSGVGVTFSSSLLFDSLSGKSVVNTEFGGVPHRHQHKRPPILAHDDDLGREYGPKGDEPKAFKTSEVMEEFRRYLGDVVLKTI